MKRPDYRPAINLPADAACVMCEFSQVHESNDAWFYCRRRSPSIVAVGAQAVWPIVKTDDWCGEYKSA